MNEKNIRELLMQFSHECLENAREAIHGYSETDNIQLSLQFMNQAFQCAKLAYSFYLQNCERGDIQHFEDFYHQFGILNHEFLKSLQTGHSLQWSLIELENLQKRYDDLKQHLG